MAAVAERLLEQDFRPGRRGPGVRRLSDRTRRLAARYLSGVAGRALVEPPRLPDDGAPAMARYLAAVDACAREAPLAISLDEELVGAATLRAATRHVQPFSELPGVSHTTLGFDRVLAVGYAGLRAEIEAGLADPGRPAERRDFSRAMLACLDAAGVWHARQVAELERLAAAADAAGDRGAVERARRRLDQCRRVPERPPETFREAVQALWSAWTFLRLCGNWSGLGRLDEMLAPFYDRDVREGRLGEGEARELLAHFWIKGAEWTGAPGAFGAGSSGDAQFYQNVVLGGVGRDGREVAGDVTRFVLEVVEELGISDFPVSVRVNPRTTPDWLWTLAARVQALGGGMVSIYNEDLVLRALERFGYPPDVARTFTNDGCWEVLIPGDTAFGYRPFDALVCLQTALGLPDPAAAADGGPPPRDYPDAPDFATVRARWRDALGARLDALHRDIDGAYDGVLASPLVAAFADGCRRTGRDYYGRGPRYNVMAPHAGGLADVANSLWAIRRHVFEKRAVTLPDFVRALADDWVGHDALRHAVLAEQRYAGNDDEDADALLRAVFDDYVELGGRVRERAGVLRPLGLSTFGRELEYRAHRHATAFGRRRGDVLAPNFGPTPGTDREGPTALILSFCAGMDFTRLANGTTLDLRLAPSPADGPEDEAALAALLRAFCALGGWHLQPDVVDAATLRAAQARPDRYPNLAVRVSGWSARFATLDAEWQNMLIQRLEHRLGDDA